MSLSRNSHVSYIQPARRIFFYLFLIPVLLIDMLVLVAPLK